ncbi:hypothetical protein MPDQ_000888 [Monascus purpureus]|uniref:Metallo-beta-lactamase domain-containing protein n=1 Tax=Monascus purpureus TaxID=5098 RepID=A0A507R5C9_MONPU|nr:hypothetical protein MPDQ_000888 [Monascus purpureus]BDD55650.1 hypothetical protein MAP00_001142 [Monascus purpureus]
MATQLVPLPEVERLSASVVRILGGNPGKFTLQGTNTYLVGRGQRRILIDTGEGKPVWTSLLRTVLQEENATVHQALITHWHKDHVNGISDLLKICPQATVYKNQPDEEGHSDIEDGQVFRVEGATLRAHYTPGHAYDHMVFVLEEEDAIFTADNVLGHGTSSFENLSDYVTSLRKMLDLVSGRAYPGHGAVIPNARARISDYIKHRQQREDEIVQLLRYGKLDVSDQEQSPERKTSWELPELVRIIYQDIPESLHVAASHGVLQVLMKLEDEGRTVHDSVSGKWTFSSGRPAL